MSYPLMPTLPISMASGLKKSPNFNTVKQKSVAGLGSGIALKPYPTWDFEFSMDNIVGRESLSSSVVAMFLGTFMGTAGGAGLFLFTDPQDNTVTGAQFGKGDGSSKLFQLSRNIYGYPDIIQNINGSILVYVNGVPTTPASVGSTGVITFTTAPANNAVLTWTGSFYYLCRFADDTVDATRSFTVNNGLDQWMMQGIKFSSEFVPTSTYGIISAFGGV